MKDYMSAIKKNRLLTSIKEDELRESLREGCFFLRTYSKNQIIHFPGDLCTKMECTLSGAVLVESIDEEGNLLAIAEFSENEILGGNLLFSKNPYYPMTITAKEETLILEINKDRLLSLFSSHPVFLKSYLEYVSDHAALLGYKIKDYANKTIRKQLTSYLEYERKKQNTSHIVLGMTKKQLAQRLGVQRTSLSRELSKMRKDGLVLYDQVSIDVLWE